ncbi:MAG TPA: serpin family protein, partial [Longimicrobiales bacterium]
MAHGTEGGHLARVAAAALVLAACGTGDPSDPSRPITELPRELTVVEREIVAGANTFGFELFRRVHAGEKAPNVFLSPLSASFALGMALNGAAGETWEGMRTGLRLGDRSEQEINEGYRSLRELLVGLDPRVEVGVGNSVWTRQGFPVVPSFYDAVRKYFNAEAQERDFDDPATLEEINAWIRKATDGMIEKGIDGISDADQAFLINAIYFVGDWTARFDPSRTRLEQFTRENGTHVLVPLMWQKGNLPYTKNAQYQAVELGYGGGAYAMVVVLPAPDVPLADIVAELSPAWWDGLVAALDSVELDLYLPKFKIEYDAYLNGPLVAMGMDRAFSADADFSRLTPGGVCIQYVRQKTFVEVDEEGTRAAAVTTVGVGVTSAPEPRIMRVDRPFLFAIRERFSGAVIFLGTIGDPTHEAAPRPQKP